MWKVNCFLKLVKKCSLKRFYDNSKLWNVYENFEENNLDLYEKKIVKFYCSYKIIF